MTRKIDWAGVWVGICVVCLCAFIISISNGCKMNDSGQTVVDWDTWGTELDLAQGTIARAKAAFPEKAELLDRLELARQDAARGVAIIKAGGPPETALDYLDSAAVIAMAISEDEDLKFAAFALSEIVARVRVYVVQETGTE